jgi:4-hydroxy 2-oxovalerate aldolase
MAISTVADSEIDQALEALVLTPVETIVVVDSYGALYYEQVRHLVKKYLKAAQSAGKEVGIHTHNNQQLAFANTIESIIQGANRIDATMYGFGRGAGNCPMELLIGFLRNPKFKLRPILKLLQDYLLDIRKQVEWGPLVPYGVTGLLNQHPRAAMAIRDSEDRDLYAEFYDQCNQ